MRAMPLWPNSGKGTHASSSERQTATLTSYLPRAEGTRAAMIVCPGGGYWELMDYEGRDFALWLNELGIAAFVLHYRLAQDGFHYPAMTDDIARAIRTVRANAKLWNVDPERIGVMGSSAGGHLASVAMTIYDDGNPGSADPIERVSSRPDLGVLCYPVISMEVSPMENLLGNNPSRELIRHLSSHLQVEPETPPCFLWHTQNDPVVKVEHALLFAESCVKNQVSLSLHIYPSGPHGIGLGVHGYHPDAAQHLHPWTAELKRWLEAQGFSAPARKFHPAEEADVVV